MSQGCTHKACLTQVKHVRLPALRSLYELRAIYLVHELRAHVLGMLNTSKAYVLACAALVVRVKGHILST
jgi:hypothetical protein